MDISKIGGLINVPFNLATLWIQSMTQEFRDLPTHALIISYSSAVMFAIIVVASFPPVLQAGPVFITKRLQMGPKGVEYCQFSAGWLTKPQAVKNYQGRKILYSFTAPQRKDAPQAEWVDMFTTCEMIQIWFVNERGGIPIDGINDR
jgi:hypothetical protein